MQYIKLKMMVTQIFAPLRKQKKKRQNRSQLKDKDRERLRTRGGAAFRGEGERGGKETRINTKGARINERNTVVRIVLTEIGGDLVQRKPVGRLKGGRRRAR